MSVVKYASRAVRKYPAFRKRARVYVPAVRQLASDVMYLKGLINSEPKYHVVQSANNFDYNGVLVSLCNIPTGDSSESRDGDRILPRYLSINLVCGLNGSVANMVIRVMVLRSWIDNGTTTGSLTVSEVLSDTGTQFSPLCHLNPEITGPRGDRGRRVEVLRNDIMSFSSTTGEHNKLLQYNIEMNGKNVQNKEHIDYINSSLGQPATGGIFVILITDNATGTNAFYHFESKLTFYDN